MADRKKTTATVASYYASLRELDFDAVLATMSPDIVQFCPVGDAPNTGRESVRKFFEGMLSYFEAIAIKEEFLYATGDDAAAKWVVNAILQGGRSLSFEGIDVFAFDDSGLISEIKAYWDPAELLGAVGQ